MANEQGWDRDQYERFKAERTRPFYDLVGLVYPRLRMRVVDLGCGSGELTQYLHRKLEARETLGVDSSPTMLEDTERYAGDGLRFERAEIAPFEPVEPLDLVFSNAALHWVPGHEELLARLSRSLSPSGQIAVQVPANGDHPSHALVPEVAGEEPFRSALGGYVHRSSALPPERYAALLDRLGFGEQLVRLQVYGHQLGSREDVVEWVKGSTLTPYRARLSPELYEQFVARYRERLLPMLEDVTPYFYTFKRILFWGRR